MMIVLCIVFCQKKFQLIFVCHDKKNLLVVVKKDPAVQIFGKAMRIVLSKNMIYIIGDRVKIVNKIVCIIFPN
jgi:hypothetical protein